METALFGNLAAVPGGEVPSGAARVGDSLAAAARIAIGESLRVREGEQVLIITNPQADVSAIAQALYDAAAESGARPILIYQGIKTQFDFAEPAVIAAFGAKPEVVISVSAEKLGKDAAGIASPYQYEGKATITYSTSSSTD